MTLKNKYYDPNPLLSYNRILSFLIGARGIGKSYAFKKYTINRFVKHGEQFIYLRRYQSELRKIKNYFDDVKDEFPENKFEVKGREFYCDGKLMGWAIPLSSWQSEKSNAYPNVTTIVFDEFMREKDNSRYLPNEVNALLNIMDTVFRDRDNARCVCLSNAVTITNPYFVYFQLTPDVNRRFSANESIVVEIPDSAEFTTYRRKTKFGKLIDGTDYGDMSLDNIFTNDNDVFLERRTKESKYQFTIAFKGQMIGVWVDPELVLLYFSEDYDPSGRVYAMTTSDMRDNFMLMTSWKRNYDLLKTVSAFKQGALRFDNQKLKTLGYELFKKMNIH